MKGGSTRHAAATQRLGFTYRNAPSAALAGVDLEFPAGDWTLVVGPGGAGKSTLVRCLNRAIPHFYPGDLRGTILVAGAPIEGRGVAEMARHVGVVFQDFESQIFSTTCLLEVAFGMENRCVPAEVARRRAAALLARVGLSGFEDRDPATLSGGEKQRLVIAAVMALDAPLVVLDEPASDLDPGGREELYRLMRSGEMQETRTGDRALILVEHDLEGLPATAGGALMIGGKVDRRWHDAGPSTLVDLAPILEAAGVRAPPIATLAARLRDRWGPAAPPLRLERAGPAELDAALRRDGWRVHPPSAPRAARTPGAPILVCRGVSHVYPNSSRPALDAVDLAVREGEMTAIIGANGSGKTTLARHLNGLLRPSAGQVLYRGAVVGGIDARRRASEIGYVFQNPDHQIFAATVRDEVAFGPVNTGLAAADVDRRVGRALEAVDLSGREGTDPFTMTKGERQRLALASVLACEPSVVIMDEPTTGLDLGQQNGVMALLGALNDRGHTILIVTHALWLLAGAVRRVIVMNGGAVAGDGPPQEILTDEKLMSAAGLRMPDLARLARLQGVPLLDAGSWLEALEPRG